jgi:hypothetical protein
VLYCSLNLIQYSRGVVSIAQLRAYLVDEGGWHGTNVPEAAHGSVVQLLLQLTVCLQALLQSLHGGWCDVQIDSLWPASPALHAHR